MIDKIKKSFSVQAENFESENMSFSKKEYLDHTIRKIIELRETEDYIETLRDISHVKNRSREEFEALYRLYGYEILKVCK